MPIALRRPPDESIGVGPPGVCRPPTVCPGYTVRLPAVHEAARALWWAEKGDLRAYLTPDEPTPGLIACIEALVAATNAVERDEYERIKRDRASAH